MKSLIRWIAASTVLGLAILATTTRADEEKVPLENVPKAVLDAVKARFPDAKLLSAEKEKEDGKTVYEIAVKNRGQNIEVTLTPEGTIVEIEKQIAAKNMPRAVAEALEAKYPKAEYKMIEEVIKVKDGKEKLEYFEVLLTTSGGKILEVGVAPNGKIVRTEDKSKKKEEK